MKNKDLFPNILDKKFNINPDLFKPYKDIKEKLPYTEFLRLTYKPETDVETQVIFKLSSKVQQKRAQEKQTQLTKDDIPPFQVDKDILEYHGTHQGLLELRKDFYRIFEEDPYQIVYYRSIFPYNWDEDEVNYLTYRGTIEEVVQYLEDPNKTEKLRWTQIYDRFLKKVTAWHDDRESHYAETIRGIQKTIHIVKERFIDNTDLISANALIVAHYAPYLQKLRDF